MGEIDIAGVIRFRMITLPKTHMNPEKGTLKDCFPIYKEKTEPISPWICQRFKDPNELDYPNVRYPRFSGS